MTTNPSLQAARESLTEFHGALPESRQTRRVIEADGSERLMFDVDQVLTWLEKNYGQQTTTLGVNKLAREILLSMVVHFTWDTGGESLLVERAYALAMEFERKQ